MARGIPIEKLRNNPYGHDLGRLLDEALRRRIDRLVELHTFHESAIRLISPIYKDHEFRYIVTGVRTLTQWGFIAHSAAELTRGKHDWLLRRRIGKLDALKRLAARGKF